jgi:hypothetical protein
VRIENLQNETCSVLRNGKTLYAMLYPFLRKVAEKEAAENPMERVIFIISYFYF